MKHPKQTIITNFVTSGWVIWVIPKLIMEVGIQISTYVQWPTVHYNTRCPVLVLLQRTNDSLQIYVDFSTWTYFAINIWSIGWSTDEHTAIHFKTLYHLMPNTLGHSSSTSQERCALWNQSSNFVKVPIWWLKITTPVEAKVTKLKTITKKGYCMVRVIICKYNRITCIKCVCKNVKKALTIVQ